MSDTKKKMYLVKREVMAHSIEEALTARGKVYEVNLAGPEYQPDESRPTGFIKKDEIRKSKKR